MEMIKNNYLNEKSNEFKSACYKNLHFGEICPEIQEVMFNEKEKFWIPGDCPCCLYKSYLPYTSFIRLVSGVYEAKFEKI